jgi:hypothetical protein
LAASGTCSTADAFQKPRAEDAEGLEGRPGLGRGRTHQPVGVARLGGSLERRDQAAGGEAILGEKPMRHGDAETGGGRQTVSAASDLTASASADSISSNAGPRRAPKRWLTAD